MSNTIPVKKNLAPHAGPGHPSPISPRKPRHLLLKAGHVVIGKKPNMQQP
jgi:hypothetical protein